MLLRSKLGFPCGSAIKNPPANAGLWVRSRGLEDPPEKEMVAHSCILAWEIPWTEESGGLQSMGWGKNPTGLSD